VSNVIPFKLKDKPKTVKIVTITPDTMSVMDIIDATLLGASILQDEGKDLAIVNHSIEMRGGKLYISLEELELG